MAFYHEMLDVAPQIFVAPFKDLSVLWLIIPLFLAWLSLVIYFSKHQSEKLGWNSAFANGIALFWIAVTLMREIFSNKPENFWTLFFILFGMMAFSFFIVFTSFKHKISDKIEFILASPTIIYFISGAVTLWVFGVLEITLPILADLFVLMVFTYLIFNVLLKKIVKPADTGDFGSSDFGSSDFGSSDFGSSSNSSDPFGSSSGGSDPFASSGSSDVGSASSSSSDPFASSGSSDFGKL